VNTPDSTELIEVGAGSRALAYSDAAQLVLAEADRARRKFLPFNSSHEGYAVIAEELDELWDDVKANNVEHAIEEAVQVGAMAVRFIADMTAKLATR
jgi:molybdopterin biosynthesis enzyme